MSTSTTVTTSRNFFIHWQTCNGFGAGFKTVTAPSMAKALAWAEAQIEPQKPLPAKPAIVGDHLDGARLDAWHREWASVNQSNLALKASVDLIRLESFFEPTLTIE